MTRTVGVQTLAVVPRSETIGEEPTTTNNQLTVDVIIPKPGLTKAEMKQQRLNHLVSQAF